MKLHLFMMMVAEVARMGFGWSLGFTPYNEWWKHSRALFHKHFKPTAVAQFRPKKLKAAHEFLRRLLDDPEHFNEHMQLYVFCLYNIPLPAHDA